MKDKVVVITGASRGLGKALAKTLTLRGATVVASDIVSVEYHADVRCIDDLKKLADNAVKRFGRIDVWINNAGVWLPRMNAEDLDMSRVRDLFEVNVFGMMQGSRVALAEMKKKGSGMIVNIISTAALVGRPLSSAYCASKHAEKGFTDSLREELKDTDIKIIGVYPGGMKTNLFDEKRPEDFDEYIDPDEVASVIVANLGKENPEENLILKRPGQKI